MMQFIIDTVSFKFEQKITIWFKIEIKMEVK